MLPCLVRNFCNPFLTMNLVGMRYRSPVRNPHAVSPVARYVLTQRRKAASYSDTSLIANGQRLKKVVARCDLTVIKSIIGQASAGTDARIYDSNLEEVRAGTDGDLRKSQVGLVQCGTDLRVKEACRIGTAFAGTDATVEDSEVDTLDAGTDIKTSNAKLRKVKAGTSISMDRTEVSESAEASCNANVTYSILTKLTCSTPDGLPMVIKGSTIGELFLKINKRIEIRSGNNVFVNSGVVINPGLMIYTNVNGEINISFLGIPVSKIARFAKKVFRKIIGLEQSAPEGHQKVILKGSKIGTIVFEKQGGRVYLEDNSEVKSVQGGIIVQSSANTGN